MRKLVTLSLCLVSMLTLQAQTTFEEVSRHPEYSGGTYCYYYGGKDKQTPPPEGYKPFYVSHYGRHGSRYMLSNKPYHELIGLFEKAEKEGILTRLGRQTLKKLRAGYAKSTGKAGELTALGGRQHEGIAERLYKRYPEVFTRTGRVEASSTMVHRAQESMQFFCGRLKHLNHDMYIMQRTTPEDTTFMRALRLKPQEGPTQKRLAARISHLSDSLKRTVGISRKFFTDPHFLKRNMKDTTRLAVHLYDIRKDMLCLPELGIRYDGIFSKTDLFNLWQRTNMDWVKTNGFIPGSTPNYRRDYNLMQDIIKKADKRIKEGGTGASLRFGHDSYLVPLAYIMKLDGSRRFPDVDHLENLYRYYAQFKITPMAGNIQLIFFRKSGSDDILVKILLNERESNIPVKTDCAPYYHWRDVKAFYEAEMNQ